MKKYKFRFPPRPKKKRPIPVKLIAVPVIIMLGLAFIAGYIWNTFKGSDYFSVQDIVCKEAEGIDLSYLKGRNVFSIDLEKESEYIHGFHPDYKKIKLVRVFPNRIFVYFVKRQPAALVKLYKYFILDKDGFLCNAPDDARDLELPIVTGLETKIFGPTAGKRYDIKETALVLSILREFERIRPFKNYRINRIDVKNIADTSIFLVFPPEAADYSKGAKSGVATEGLQIKLGFGNIRRKLAILAGVITRGKLDLANIKYIDLRFEKPVIKYGDIK